MGVDTKGHVNRSIEVEDIRDTLKSMGADKIDIKMGTCSAHFIILFDHMDYQRMMHFHYGLGLFGSNIISLGADEQAETIIEEIVHRFGGVFIPNDCEDGNATVYDDSNAMLNNGDAKYILKWGIANGYIKGSTTYDVNVAQEKFDEWLRPNM